MVSKALGKYVQSLHQKKYRHRHGAFLVEGGKNVLELLSSDLEVEHVLATAEFIDQNRARLPARLPLSPATETELTQLGTLATNNTALAVVRLPAETALPLTLPETGLLLALDEVRDPGNLGTLLRLADWYGLPGVVLSPGCADAYAPKTVAASMGAFARVRVWERDLTAWLPTLAPAVGIFGADLAGNNVHRLTLRPAGVLVMGSESHGLTPGVGAALTRRLHIPRGAGGQAESLNVAISAAILLDNFFRNQ
ncbi:RNA methyltransferase [Hymenobacter artigasi]|uniref:TrmH family RNA methyltransferase n=1 Tax=Hymenobacter artigasi TaxID=2719616 RepID=A0ABX1HG60_9BACT|nr:RNA methyltransferase [Hymenobacter artigasi]NKI89238.1 TrmH family RNA methyltransferase [Hymenobacter artigasi]